MPCQPKSDWASLVHDAGDSGADVGEGVGQGGGIGRLDPDCELPEAIGKDRDVKGVFVEIDADVD